MIYIVFIIFSFYFFDTSVILASDSTISIEEITDETEFIGVVSCCSQPTIEEQDADIECIDSGAGSSSGSRIRCSVPPLIQRHMSFYSESIEKSLLLIENKMDQWRQINDPRPKAIIIGENHESFGNAYFENKLLSSLKSVGFNTLYSEVSQNSFDRWKMYSVLQAPTPIREITDILCEGKVEIAYDLGYTVIPFDVLEASTLDALSSFKERFKAVSSHEREQQMISNVRRANTDFVCITGSMHLSGFVKDAAFNEKFNVLYFNCDPVDSGYEMRYCNILRVAQLEPPAILDWVQRYRALKQAPIVQLPITINPGISSLDIYELKSDGLNFYFMNFEIPEARKNEFYKCFPNSVKMR